MAFVTKLTLGFLNFLKYRKQRVVIGGEHSTWTQVMSGVPQGTVLGPLLFLTYINDLPNNIHSSIRLFADDCVLYREIKNEIDSQELQKDLNSLMKWEYDWQMNCNPKKCFVMRLTHARHMTDPVQLHLRRQITSGNWQSSLSRSSYYQRPNMEQTHPPNYCHSQPYPCIRKTQSLLMPSTTLHSHSSLK